MFVIKYICITCLKHYPQKTRCRGGRGGQKTTEIKCNTGNMPAKQPQQLLACVSGGSMEEREWLELNHLCLGAEPPS